MAVAMEEQKAGLCRSAFFVTKNMKRSKNSEKENKTDFSRCISITD